MTSNYDLMENWENEFISAEIKNFVIKCDEIFQIKQIRC